MKQNSPHVSAPRYSEAIVALGANLGERDKTIAAAFEMLGRRIGLVLARSSLVETSAEVLPEYQQQIQPPYLNAVAVLLTALSPESLLENLLEIERSLGRNRHGAATGDPRVIDLDLIAYGRETRETSALTLPHPRMHQRRFVLAPLCELWPTWRHPRLGKTAAEMLGGLPAFA